MEFVSLAKSRAGWQPDSETPAKKKAKPNSEATPQTSATPAANTDNGGESASIQEEG